jgi:hypothetical protein
MMKRMAHIPDEGICVGVLEKACQGYASLVRAFPME